MGSFHATPSEIMHIWYGGDPVTYYTLDPSKAGSADGGAAALQVVCLGPEQPVLVVPSGWWKASRLQAGPRGYGSVVEVVVPEFSAAGTRLAGAELCKAFPAHASLIGAHLSPNATEGNYARMLRAETAVRPQGRGGVQ